MVASLLIKPAVIGSFLHAGAPTIAASGITISALERRCEINV